MKKKRIILAALMVGIALFLAGVLIWPFLETLWTQQPSSAAAWRGSIEVEIRQDGTMLDTLGPFVDDCNPFIAGAGTPETPTGQCGGVSYTVDLSTYSGPIEVWQRFLWTDGDRIIYGFHVPDGCDLTGAGCAIVEENGTVDITPSCMAALETCGTQRDERHYWYDDTLEGSGSHVCTVEFRYNTVGWDGAFVMYEYEVDISERVAEGLQVLYTFEEGSGTTVQDVSGVGVPLDLNVSDGAAISWISGGLVINSSTIMASAGAATKVIDAARASNGLTIEAWIKPRDTSQDGPARIVTLSQDLYSRNFTLGQGLWGSQPSDLYDVRLRTTTTGNNGTPSLTTPAGLLTTELTHVVYTRGASGVARVYIDSVERVNGTVGGDFSNWDESHRLVLGNELTGDRPWLGELHLVAIYDRALSQAEISQNFEAGADNLVTPTATSTPTPMNTPTSTATSLPTNTPTSTFTPMPTDTSTPMPIPTGTFTPTPTSTFTPTVTVVPTVTPTSTFTPVPTSTSTPTGTFAPTPTDIPTDIPTPTSTFTPTPTPFWEIITSVDGREFRLIEFVEGCGCGYYREIK